MVKEIKAIVQPFMVQHVVGALQEMPGLPGVTVSDVRGFGRNRARDASDKIIENSIGYARKVKLEIVVPDDRVDAVLAAIEEHARTGRLGDGKIFVYPVEEVVKIRNGKRGEGAI